MKKNNQGIHFEVAKNDCLTFGDLISFQDKKTCQVITDDFVDTSSAEYCREVLSEKFIKSEYS